ncbi:MAG: DUF2312 domain-containing protein [Pseudorhodoplanes sp.]|jgi:uncharacterized protein (UPF0335 family)|nr:DUF2312 domain-containing protein [Pseudorhodoplanes sp.]
MPATAGAAAQEGTAGPVKAFVERAEKLEGEKKAIFSGICGVYAESKANGFKIGPRHQRGTNINRLAGLPAA